ncbi:MAG: hypothetical protein M3Y59_25140 [Myxococcota bacterium]|nr:hypothetical protein [Myxococcota bacterium]
MKRAHLLVLSLCLTASTGCIRWEDADASWCNDAVLERRHDVCGRADTSIAGPVPGIEASQRFGGEGLDTVAALASLPSGMWFGGSFDAPMKLGTTSLVSSGDADAYLARMDAEGRFVSAVSFGGFGADRVVDVQAGPADSLYVAAQFQSHTTLPGGGNLSSEGELDSLLLRLDSTLQPLASVSFAAEPGARVEVRDLAYDRGRVVVAGRLVGYMNLGGVRVGNGGPAAFLAVLDEDLRPLGQVATGSCTDAIGDSAAVGEQGVFFTFRIHVDPLGPGCVLLNQPLDPGFSAWRDVLVRIDDAETSAPFIPPDWAFQFPDSVRNPYQLLTGSNPVLVTSKPGYEAPNSVAVLGEELVFMRHTPDSSQQRRPWAEVSFRSAGSALPTRGPNTIGRANSTQVGLGQDLHAKMQVGEDGALWVFGEFKDDRMLLGSLVNGPFVNARHGFVRVYHDTDPTQDWARVLVGRSPSVGAMVTAVAVDPSGRAWIAGNFEGDVVASHQWLDAKGSDGFLFITEPAL